MKISRRILQFCLALGLVAALIPALAQNSTDIIIEIPDGAKPKPTPTPTPTPTPCVCHAEQQWFINNRNGPPRPGNQVTELIDGRATFRAMVDAIRTATGQGHFVYLINWWLSDDFALIPGDATTTMNALLTAASGRGVEVRAMLWDQVGTQNDAEAARITALNTGAAIVDDRTLNIGSHHQKILLVNGTEGLIAFCGGIDFNPDRIMPVNRADAAGSDFHDVHCRIVGPAAWDLLQIFVQRWNDHPAHLRFNPAAKRNIAGAALAMPAAIGAATHTVQIGRTYGNGSAHRGIDSAGAFFTPTGYTFAANGETTARQMFLQAISQAHCFIYIEDQYMVDLAAARALAAALPRLQHITILIPATQITNLAILGGTNQTGHRRRQFLDILRADPRQRRKVRVFELRRAGRPHTYVHAKTWIFDDCYAIIGSANMNRRSWTHDSEVVAGIQDTVPAPALGFAKQLRMNLWAEHLNVAPARVQDGVASAQLWITPPGGARIRRFDADAGPTPAPNDVAQWDNNWNTYIDPDGS